MNGKRRGGNIKEWTGIDFSSSLWAAGNRTRWNGVVVVICGVPTNLQGYTRLDYEIRFSYSSIITLQFSLVFKSDLISHVVHEKQSWANCELNPPLFLIAVALTFMPMHLTSLQKHLRRF